MMTDDDMARYMAERYPNVPDTPENRAAIADSLGYAEWVLARRFNECWQSTGLPRWLLRAAGVVRRIMEAVRR